MNTLETDIADYLAHLRAQLEQIEREVTKGPWELEETTQTLWLGRLRRDGIKMDEIVIGFSISDLTEAAEKQKRNHAAFIANARTAYPASIARELRLIEAMWTIVSQDSASVEDIRATYGVEYSPPPCLLEVALRDIIAEWKGANK